VSTYLFPAGETRFPKTLNLQFSCFLEYVLATGIGINTAEIFVSRRNRSVTVSGYLLSERLYEAGFSSLVLTQREGTTVSDPAGKATHICFERVWSGTKDAFIDYKSSVTAKTFKNLAATMQTRPDSCKLKGPEVYRNRHGTCLRKYHHKGGQFK
jgi:hypothetical protein